eukprot:XP_011679754.1 PREDICTED: uncharacterized protein LOC105445657 [Strongylocentrotus purpuratus]
MNETPNNSNLSVNSSILDEYDQLPPFLAVLGYSYFILNIVSCLGSTLTMTCILFNKKLRKPTNIIPFNIILCDFITVFTHCVLFVLLIDGVSSSFSRLVIYTADFVSVINILLAAVHQFITIRVDPFGAHGIITTPRIIAACVTTWLLCIPIAYPISTTQDLFAFYISAVSTDVVLLLITGLFYLFVYTTVSKGPPGVKFSEQRKLENRKVFTTIAFVYVTTLFFRTIYRVEYVIAVCNNYSISHILIGNIFFSIGTMSNSLVYWWRLKEFRSMLTKCRNTRTDVMIDGLNV